MIIHMCTLSVALCILKVTVGTCHQLYATKRGLRYTGNETLKNVSVSSITKCQVLCQTTSNCTASNFGPVNSAESGKNICELLNADFNNEEALVRSQGWIYTEEHHACTKDPCAQGTCQVVGEGFICVCADGFDGRLCDENIDECASSPCVNGECIDGVNGYSCHCEEVYQGTLCNENIDECASSPCVHGGCVDGINGFTCTCDDGYTGVTCDENIDECQSSPCIHGSCIDGVNQFSCDCDQGFTGTRCETYIDPCASEPCNNGGECLEENDGYRCACRYCYGGSQCQSQRLAYLIAYSADHVPDSALSASSFDPDYPVSRSRMDAIYGFRFASAAIGGWLQVDLGSDHWVFSITTRGIQEMGQHVSKFKLAYSNAFMPGLYTIRDDIGQDKIFDSNTNWYSSVSIILPDWIEARYVRLTVVEFYSWPSMKWDLEGCPII